MARSNMELPSDLVSEILLNLPVKSIVRFKSLAKTWYHLLKSPAFVSRHLSLSKKKNRNKNSHSIVVHYYDRYLDRKNTGMLLFADEKTLLSYRDLGQHLPCGFAAKRDYLFTVGDGLICLYDFDSSSMILWNPAIKESRVLPNRNQFKPGFFSYLGCGMDPLSNDYKVTYIRRFCYYIEYAIYSMSSDSWRVFKEEDGKIVKKLHIMEYCRSYACVNGVGYWHFSRGSRESKVFAFNLSTEVFQVLNSPNPGINGALIPLRDGRITFWNEKQPDSIYPFVVWVLNDEGNWTKLMNIDPPPKVRNIYGFWTHGKVFAKHEDGTFLLYDLDTKEFSDPGFQPFAYHKIEVYSCEESLLAVKRE